MDRVGKFGIATLLCLAFGVASCGDSTAPDEDAGPITLKIVGGEGQTAVVGTELADPLVVKATNHRGRPLRRYLVNFVVTKGDGSVYAGAAMTNWRGVAQDYWTLGLEPGKNVVEVRAVNSWTGEKQVFATFTATATPVPVHTVEVTPESADLQLIVDVTEQLDVVLKAEDGTVLTDRDVEWSSSNAAVATVDDDGLVTAQGVGVAMIRATSDNGKFDEAEITVKGAPVFTVLVQPADFDLVVGGDPSTQQLTVTLLDKDGIELTGRDVSFSHDPAGVVTVTADGLVTAVAEGVATITATSEGEDGEAKVTVTDGAPVIPEDAYEPNNSLVRPKDLMKPFGPFDVLGEGEPLSIVANFHEGDTQDWYRVKFREDVVDPGACDPVLDSELYDFIVDLTNIPLGSNYDLELYSSGGGPPTLLGSSTNGDNAAEKVTARVLGFCEDPTDFEFLIKVIQQSGPATADLYSLSMILSRP